ncbi:hypothetical protein B0H13DRAFT_2403522 [Mycena leptocephala]|nr:hypothetical protein B0H13DRAFT_2403522 [Mycena leptocephala]
MKTSCTPGPAPHPSYHPGHLAQSLPALPAVHATSASSLECALSRPWLVADRGGFSRMASAARARRLMLRGLGQRFGCTSSRGVAMRRPRTTKAEHCCLRHRSPSVPRQHWRVPPDSAASSQTQDTPGFGPSNLTHAGSDVHCPSCAPLSSLRTRQGTRMWDVSTTHDSLRQARSHGALAQSAFYLAPRIACTGSRIVACGSGSAPTSTHRIVPCAGYVTRVPPPSRGIACGEAEPDPGSELRLAFGKARAGRWCNISSKHNPSQESGAGGHWLLRAGGIRSIAR